MNALEQRSSLFALWMSWSKALPKGTAGLCVLFLGNLAVILLVHLIPTIDKLVPKLGLLPLRNILLMGMGFGEVIIVFLLMGFGHFRAPWRQVLCSFGLFWGVGVWQYAQGAEAELMALSQLFALGGLWISYALFVSFRVFFRLEFGVPVQGLALPPRSAQFGLYSISTFVAILAVAFAFVRLLVTLNSLLSSSRHISLAELLAPFGFLFGVLLFSLPILITSLGRRTSRIWIVTAAIWGGVPVIFAALTMPLDGVALFFSFWATVVANLAGFRLIGFRWLPVAPIAAKRSPRRNSG